MKRTRLGPGRVPVLGESPRSLLYVTFPQRPRRGAASAPLTLRAGRLPGDGRPPPAAPVRGPGPPESWRPPPAAPVRGPGPPRELVPARQRSCVPSAVTTVHGPRLRARRVPPMENRGISVIPSTFLGPEAVAVLAGVPGLVVNLLFCRVH